MDEPSGGDVWRKIQKAAIAQQPGPQLYADDAKDEENEKAQQKNVPKHW